MGKPLIKRYRLYRIYGKLLPPRRRLLNHRSNLLQNVLHFGRVVGNEFVNDFCGHCETSFYCGMPCRARPGIPSNAERAGQTGKKHNPITTVAPANNKTPKIKPARSIDTEAILLHDAMSNMGEFECCPPRLNQSDDTRYQISTFTCKVLVCWMSMPRLGPCSAAERATDKD